MIIGMQNKSLGWTGCLWMRIDIDTGDEKDEDAKKCGMMRQEGEE